MQMPNKGKRTGVFHGNLQTRMSRSSEDVLLQIAAVKYKKYEGILFVMAERIGWMPGSKVHFIDGFAAPDTHLVTIIEPNSL
jgi:hypothetical protein